VKFYTFLLILIAAIGILTSLVASGLIMDLGPKIDADDTIPQAYEGKLTNFSLQGVSKYEDIYIQIELDDTIIVVAEIADRDQWKEFTGVPLVYGWRYTVVVDGGTLVEFRLTTTYDDSEGSEEALVGLS
jgi:hypothetical protein